MLNIKKIRTAKGLQQTKLAEMLDVPQSTVSMWESGKSNPRMDMIPSVAKALNVKIDELFEQAN